MLGKLVSEQGNEPADKVNEKIVFVSIAKVLNIYNRWRDRVESKKKNLLIHRITCKDSSPQAHKIFFEGVVKVISEIKLFDFSSVPDHKQFPERELSREVIEHEEWQCFSYDQISCVVATLSDILELLDLYGSLANLERYQEQI